MLGFLQGGEDAFVILWHHFHEFWHHLFPKREHLKGFLALGVIGVVFHQRADGFDFLGVLDFFERDHLGVDPRAGVAGFIQDVSRAAAHAGGEVATGFTEDDDLAASHVFAAVITDAFDDAVHAGVPHSEPFARDAAQIQFASRRAVKCDVASDDVFLRGERRFR